MEKTGKLSPYASAAGVRPVRFTDKQLKHFESNEAQLLRARCPAGVCLAVDTDAAWLELELLVEGAARAYAQATAIVRDRWADSVSLGRIGALPHTAVLKLPLEPPAAAGELRRVEAHLPQAACLTVVDVRLPPGAFAAPAKERPGRRLLCLGDSITQGLESRNPVGTYPIRLARLLNAELLNQGVGGLVFDPDSFDPELPFEPDLITIAYGVNDWAKDAPAAEIENRAQRYMERVCARYAGVPVLVITPIWHREEELAKAAGTLADVRAAITRVASGFAQARVVDGSKLVPCLPHLFADGVHPTEEGFGHYAAELYRYAATAIRR
ncbi:SGNH/GDSL hydrolase family protein [Paenibacillus arenilitoris]|uniref:SGNH/GDSL hydrolase family protein n=1 Tax=Paenibacillus arenilitoris TaxID=2772299 RepID=A0A927CJS5_9BACL|nr:SGNH/GDSL hydrolase family protein [Paenibacillus arenilitoris]MBD2866980.1 SGNH/GDSL hydrolase family protein [Paenibacillus arenilitoris]